MLPRTGGARGVLPRCCRGAPTVLSGYSSAAPARRRDGLPPASARRYSRGAPISAHARTHTRPSAHPHTHARAHQHTHACARTHARIENSDMCSIYGEADAIYSGASAVNSARAAANCTPSVTRACPVKRTRASTTVAQYTVSQYGTVSRTARYPARHVIPRGTVPHAVRPPTPAPPVMHVATLHYSELQRWRARRCVLQLYVAMLQSRRVGGSAPKPRTSRRSCAGAQGLTPPTSALGLDSPRSRLPGTLGSPRPHLRRDFGLSLATSAL